MIHYNIVKQLLNKEYQYNGSDFCYTYYKKKKYKEEKTIHFELRIITIQVKYIIIPRI